MATTAMVHVRVDEEVKEMAMLTAMEVQAEHLIEASASSLLPST